MQAREWLVLERRTVADTYLYVMCRWQDKSPTPLASYPALAVFAARLDQDPAVRQAQAEETADP